MDYHTAGSFNYSKTALYVMAKETGNCPMTTSFIRKNQKKLKIDTSKVMKKEPPFIHLFIN